MFIKICGITTLEQALACIEYGANCLGFNCYSGSKRYVPPELVIDIVKQLPSTIKTAGVFVNEPLESLHQLMQASGMDWAQLHGDESLDYYQSVQARCFKAFRLSPDFQLETISTYTQNTDLFLLDAYHPQEYGGTGATIDWNLAQQANTFGKLILAGGLNPDNVADAIKVVQPYGIDVCSGVESSPGVKDLQKVKELIGRVKPNTPEV